MTVDIPKLTKIFTQHLLKLDENLAQDPSESGLRLKDGELFESCALVIERDGGDTSGNAYAFSISVIPKFATIPFLCSGGTIALDSAPFPAEAAITVDAALFPGVHIEDQVVGFHNILERSLNDSTYQHYWGLRAKFGYKGAKEAASHKAKNGDFALPAGGILLLGGEVDFQGIARSLVINVFLHRWLSALLVIYSRGVEQALHFPQIIQTDRTGNGDHQMKLTKAEIFRRQSERLGAEDCRRWMTLAGQTFSRYATASCNGSFQAFQMNLPDPSEGLVPRDQEELVKIPRQFRSTALSYMLDRQTFVSEPYMVSATRGLTLPRPPIWIHRQAGRYLPEYHEVKAGRSLLEITADPPSAAALTMQPITRYGMDAAIIYSDILIIPQALGMHLDFKPQPVFHKNVETEEDVERLVYNSQALEITFEALRLTKKELLKYDKDKLSNAYHKGKRHTALIGFCGAPITVMDYMTGKNGMDWIKNRPLATAKMLDKITMASVDYLCKQVSEGGADMVQVFDSSGGSFDQDVYMQHGFPCLQKIAVEFKKRHPFVPIQVFPRGATHAIPAFVNHTLYDTISLDEVLTPEEARNVAGPHVTLQGNFNCDFMYESYETIVEKGREMVQRFGDHSQFKRHHIVNLSHGMRPDMKPESVAALVEAVQTLCLGSRQSPLALAQARIVEKGFVEAFPQHRMKITAVKTKGDKILDVPLSRIGGDKGLFTKELEWSLIRGEVDIVQHSLKDLETIVPPGLEVVAMLQRADRRDAVVMVKDKVVKESHGEKIAMDMIPRGAVVGTSSVRRLAQLSLKRPDLVIKDVRGNLNTRLRKLMDGQYDALILACAGLDRLPRDTTTVLSRDLDMKDAMPADHFDDLLSNCEIFRLDEHEMLPAVGQGVLAVQTRETDFGLNDLFINSMDHYGTRRCATEERAFLRELEGGCQVPIGVAAAFNSQLDVVKMEAQVYPTKDSTLETITVVDLGGGGRETAKRAFEQGAKDIVALWRTKT